MVIIEQEKWRTFLNITTICRDETVSRNEWDGDMKAIFSAEEIWFAAETNTSFPKLDGIQRWSWNWDSHWKEIWKPVETNTIQHFPKLEAVSLPTSSVFGRFQTLCEEKNTQKPIQQWVYMYGRANQSFPTCLVPNKSLNLASTFSASPHRGLRHSSQYQTARSK